MIDGFKHKGLRNLFERNDAKGVNAEHVRKIKQILSVMDVAEKVEDLDLATFRLHALTGDLNGFWSIVVRANWRIVFRFHEGLASKAVQRCSAA